MYKVNSNTWVNQEIKMNFKDSSHLFNSTYFLVTTHGLPQPPKMTKERQTHERWNEWWELLGSENTILSSYLTWSKQHVFSHYHAMCLLKGAFLSSIMADSSTRPASINYHTLGHVLGSYCLQIKGLVKLSVPFPAGRTVPTKIQTQLQDPIHHHFLQSSSWRW